MLEGLEKGLVEKEKLDYKRLDFAYIDKKQQFTRVAPEKLKAILSKR